MADGGGELHHSSSSGWPAHARTQETIQRFQRWLSGCAPIISLAAQSLLPLESEQNIQLAERNTHGWTPSPNKAIREGFAPFLGTKKNPCCQDGFQVFLLLWLRRASLQMKRYQFYPSWGRRRVRASDTDISAFKVAFVTPLTSLWDDCEELRYREGDVSF